LTAISSEQGGGLKGASAANVRCWPAGAAGAGEHEEGKLVRLAALTEIERIKEMQRRKRISEANRGRSPWNKGRRHSPGKQGGAVRACEAA
jgi:hypothetical protein